MGDSQSSPVLRHNEFRGLTVPISRSVPPTMTMRMACRLRCGRCRVGKRLDESAACLQSRRDFGRRTADGESGVFGCRYFKKATLMNRTVPA